MYQDWKKFPSLADRSSLLVLRSPWYKDIGEGAPQYYDNLQFIIMIYDPGWESRVA